MREHVASMTCWCKPVVEHYRGTSSPLAHKAETPDGECQYVNADGARCRMDPREHTHQ